ncbi:hypothetical protein J2T20_000863 [Paenibacillus wynnii]|nr:hypothetical protein [Paenibacillus wynnii]
MGIYLMQFDFDMAASIEEVAYEMGEHRGLLLSEAFQPLCTP